MCPTAPSRSFGDWNQPHITRPKKRQPKQSENELSPAKAFFQNRLIYRYRVVLRCWVFSNTFCWGSLQLASCEPMGDDMKRDFAVGDNAAAQAWRWFSVLRSFHHDGTSPSARRKRQLGGACCGVLEYADALAEAGSGKTCAVDVQAADVCHVVSASFVWGGQKNRSA